MSGSVITYTNTDGYEYRARCTGELNSQKTTIKGRWVNGYHETKGPWSSTLSLFDHGNGVVVEGAGISLSLDYGQMADLYHLFDAHNRGNDLWMWGTYEASVKKLSERKPRKKVDKKKKKK